MTTKLSKNADVSRMREVSSIMLRPLACLVAVYAVLLVGAQAATPRPASPILVTHCVYANVAVPVGGFAKDDFTDHGKTVYQQCVRDGSRVLWSPSFTAAALAKAYPAT
jgi:hypothetical protein